MGTRGCWGFRQDGQDKLTYNHFDSYPTGLGQELVDALKEVTDMTFFKTCVRDLELVKTDVPPTKKQIEKLCQFTDLTVSERSTADWYCLLHDCQGDLHKTLEASVMSDDHHFMNDSLFCEWAYVINLDDDTFEIYEGFQKKCHALGRYASGPSDGGYFPVALVSVFPLNRIPKDFAKVLEKSENDDD